MSGVALIEADAAGFDYTVLDADAAGVARGAADAIRGELRRSVAAIGAHLHVVKNKLAHGQFTAWVQSELRMTQRSAQNYMAAATFLRDKSEALSLLPPTLIYALASPTAPAVIVQEVVAAAEAGRPLPPRAIAERLGAARKEEQQLRHAARRSPGRSRKEPLAAARLYQQRKDRQHQALLKQRQREEDARAERLRPLAHRIAAVLCDDLAPLLAALRDWRDSPMLIALLSDVANAPTAAA